ncbi:unnamed protein product, partial [Rotaria sordida]
VDLRDDDDADADALDRAAHCCG